MVRKGWALLTHTDPYSTACVENPDEHFIKQMAHYLLWGAISMCLHYVCATVLCVCHCDVCFAVWVRALLVLVPLFHRLGPMLTTIGEVGQQKQQQQ